MCDLAAKLKFWETDLPITSSLFACWIEGVGCSLGEKTQWQISYTNLLECLQQAYGDQLTNVEQLLRSGCTLPVRSAEAERAFSASRRLKTYLCSKMPEERLSGRVFMHIYYSLHTNVKEICHKYIRAKQEENVSGLPHQAGYDEGQLSLKIYADWDIGHQIKTCALNSGCINFKFNFVKSWKNTECLWCVRSSLIFLQYKTDGWIKGLSQANFLQLINGLLLVKKFLLGQPLQADNYGIRLQEYPPIHP